MKHLKLKRLMVVFGTLFFMSFAFFVENVNAGPVLYFSDMTDGPTTGWEGSSTKGAAVSIWGRNFGTSRGTSYVTVGGVNLTSESDYAEWGATTNPIVPLGMQRITFYLNSSMSTIGTYPNETISITTSEGTSGTIPFHCRALGSNHIYFLDNVTGDDNDSGLTPALAKKTTAWARGNLEAGDVVYLKDSGTPYTDHDIDTGYHYGGLFTFGANPSHNNGTQGNSITVTAYPGDNVKMEANEGLSGTELRSVIKMRYSGTQLQFWTFSKLTMEGIYSAISLGGSGYSNGGISHFRIIGNDCTTILSETSGGCIITLYGCTYGMDHLYMYGNYLHDQCANFRGQDTGRRVYQVYIGGYGALDHLYVGWNDMGWGSQGRGFQVYGHTPEDTLDNFYVHDNWFHDNVRQCVILGGGDGSSPYSFVKNAYFYNNILSDPGPGDCVIVIAGVGNGSAGGNFYIYNNTFYSPDSSNPILNITGYMEHFDFKNNIIYGNDTPWDYVTYHPSTGLGSPTGSRDHNIYYGNGADGKPSWDNSTLDNNAPLFSVSSPDEFSEFNIQSTSPAIDAGTSDVSAIVTKDFTGNSRPMDGDENGTAEYDIGAYEYTGTYISDTTPPTRSNGAPTGELSPGTTQIAISLTTDENAVCKYSTTPGTDYSLMQNTFSTTNSTTHSTLITGLEDGNTYTCYVRCEDIAGNTNSDDFLISFEVGDSSGDDADDGDDINDDDDGDDSGGNCFITTTASCKAGFLESAGKIFKCLLQGEDN